MSAMNTDINYSAKSAFNTWQCRQLFMFSTHHGKSLGHASHTR